MGLNVMVVDDSTVMRSMIVRILRLTGLPLTLVLEADSGEQALKQLEDNWIDLALVDLNMPGMGGEALIERIRSTPEIADVSIIVVSSESSEVRIERLQKAGVTFVHKPFDADKLREIICQVTGGSHAIESTGDPVPSVGGDF